MKILIVFFLSSMAFASVVPDRIVTMPLDIFSSSNKTLKNGNKEVRVTSYKKRSGEFFKNGTKQVLTPDIYEGFVAMSMPVLQSVPSNQNGSRGTAFHIGHNLIITNNHVLDPTFKNTTRCNNFVLKDNLGTLFSCKKVHYCSAANDVCLIEMNNSKKSQKECAFCRSIKVTVSLEAAHQLKSHYSPTPSEWPHEVLTAVGNSAGLGIHLSQGMGVRLKGADIHFFAPITRGNSGGALLNQEGLVVGLVSRQLGFKQDSYDVFVGPANKVSNVAYSSTALIELIRTALGNNPEILEKFNQSVVE